MITQQHHREEGMRSSWLKVNQDFKMKTRRTKNVKISPTVFELGHVHESFSGSNVTVSPKETFSPHARHCSLTEAARVLLKARV